METEIIPILSKYISTEILKQPGRVIQPGEKLLTSGLIDSFHLVDMALYIEDKFGVRIEDTELNSDTFNTLDELAVLIRQRQGIN